MDGEAVVPVRGRRRRVIALTVATVLVLLVGALAWIGIRAWMAKGELEAAAQQADALQSAMTSGDVVAATAEADALARHTTEAAALTGDPIWRSAEWVPGLGPNLHAVRVVASELHSASIGAIRPLAALAETLGPAAFRPVGGTLAVQPLIDAQATLSSARSVLVRASAGLDGIADDGLIAPVSHARDDLAGALARAAALSVALDNSASVLPAMLGADGPRNYLVLFQNSAELRASGGITGALALIHTDAGRFELAAQATSDDFVDTQYDPVPVPDGTSALYGAQPGAYIQDVTMTPDFAVSAVLAKQMWERRFGGTVDGVIAVDPVALSYLLEATGPVALPDGTELSSANAVQTLLVDAYHRFDTADQNVFFASAASVAFSAVVSGNTDPSALITAFTRAGNENRIAVWSADEAVQKRLATTTLAGLSAAQRLAGPQAYGVYLNDGTGGKMDPYLEVGIATGTAETRADGRSDVTVRVTMTNRAPADAAETLPADVTGNGIFGVRAGMIRTIMAVYAPPGAFDAGVRYDGDPVGYTSGEDAGHLVSTRHVTLDPGESATFTFHFISAEAGQSTPAVIHTPLMSPIEVGTL